jgi:drug/metabolite transporter (DMT)-like permease
MNPPSDRHTHLDALAVVLLVVCCTLWGLNQVAVKLALAEVPPLTQASLRSVGAALLVLAWSRWRALPLFDRDLTLRAGLAAGALFAAEFACIFIGLQFTTASRMVVFLYLSPFVVALGMPLIARGERLSISQWLGLGVAFAGVAWAFAEGFAPNAKAPPMQWLGDALGLAAAVLWGATTLVIRATRLGSALAEKALLYQLAVSGGLLWLAAVAAGEPWPHQWSVITIGSLGFQTVIVTFASYLAWFWLVRHYPATRIAAFTLLTPVAGLAAGVLLLNEPLTARLVIALCAVVVGLALVNRRQGGPQRQETR